jgi:DNA polymerase-4
LLGVGRKTEKLLLDLNIRTVAQLRRLSRDALSAMLGQRGEVLYERSRGRDVWMIRPERLPRTISRETTFHQPVSDGDEIRAMLFYLVERAMRTLRQGRLQMRTVELTIRYADWRQLNARTTLPYATRLDEEVYVAVCGLLERLYKRRVSLRHVGVVLSGLGRACDQPALFEEPRSAKSGRLHEAMDRIRDRWGHAAVVTGKSIDLLNRLEQNDYGFVLRTPSLTK